MGAVYFYADYYHTNINMLMLDSVKNKSDLLCRALFVFCVAALLI